MSSRKSMLDSFQKNEALALTDNSDAFKEWPVTANTSSRYFNSKSSTNYFHQPITKARAGPRATTVRKDLLPRAEPDIATMEQKLAMLKSKTKRILASPENFHQPADPDSIEQARSPPSKQEQVFLNNNHKFVMDPTSNMDHLLSRAESLLQNVTTAKNQNQQYNSNSRSKSGGEFISRSGGNIPLLSHPSAALSGTDLDRLYHFPQSKSTSTNPSAPHPMPVYLSSAVPVPSYDTSQVDWLLRGLPEAYEDELVFDDEAIEALINEGGKPPSQLALPSMYAINQRTMSSLVECKYLHLNLTNILVYTARSGVRREGAYMLLHPPAGCSIPYENSPDYVTIPLPELLDDIKLSEQNKIRSKKDSLRVYFVGGLSIEKHVSLPLHLTDKV